jgi:DNA polymerase-3 subunit delta'
MIEKNVFSENVLKTLDSFFADGRRPHAMLIDGASQEQRKNLALLAARMMVCENKDRTPCGECEHCRKAKENIHPDIITIKKPDDKKHFVKDDVKKMVADAYLTPNEADVKVFVVEELQLMTEESQNLLLKILEEPPRYTAFVLTSENSNAVIGTVLSRVVRLRMGNTIATEYSEKAEGIVKRLVDAVLSPYEYDRIEATALMDGNKTLTAEVLDLFISILRDAIVRKSNGKVLLDSFESASQKLSSSLTLEKMLEMYETVDGLLKSLENNPNYTLLSAVLCAKI